MIKEKTTKLSVTIAIPVKNEEINLAHCLERLERFAEIVVIDSTSTDRTVQIAEEFGARVVNFQWDGAYPKKRNWFLMNKPPTQPWVLFLDADEFIDDVFCNALDQELSTQDENGNSGYWLEYKNFFLDRELKHGVMQRKLALFRVGKALYEQIDEENWSKLDMEIHEHPIVEGSVGTISAPIEHRDFKGLATFIDKHCDYAQWEAARYTKLQNDHEAWKHLTPRQTFKYRHLASWWYPTFYFLLNYIVKLGFLDGAAGYHYSSYKAWYFQTIRLLIREQSSNTEKIS